LERRFDSKQLGALKIKVEIARFREGLMWCALPYQAYFPFYSILIPDPDKNASRLE